MASPKRQINSVFIVNKSGGMMYYKDFVDLESIGLDKTGIDEKILRASTWHSLHAIGGQLSPLDGCHGIEVLEADTHALHCFQAATGAKFVAATDRNATNIQGFLVSLYRLYADFVLKNPFYEMDQPINCELFELHLSRIVY